MISASALVFAIGVTCGALLGRPALILMPVLTFIVVALARQRATALVAVALLGAATGDARVLIHDIEALDATLVSAVQIEGVIPAAPQIGPSGPRASIDVLRIRNEERGAWREASGTLLVFFGDTVPDGVQRNDRILIRGDVERLDSLDPDFRRFVRSEGAAGVAWAFTTSISARDDHALNIMARLRNEVTDSILSALPGDPGALIAGFVTGDDSGLSPAAREAFERTNTSHITAVSGGNVAILIAMWSVMVRSGRFRRHVAFQVMLIAAIWCYVGLVGFGPAALRAALFATLMILGPRFGRKPDPMMSLMLASAILLLIRPDMADSVGFWLSMSASAALVTVAPLVKGEDTLKPRGVVLGLIAAQFATLPITFWIFGEWSPASFVANLLIGPMVSLLFPIAFACAALFLVAPFTASFIGWIPGTGAEIILATVESLGSDFPLMRSGSLSGTGVALIAVLCAMVIACLSVDFRRWISRIEFAHRNSSGAVPAGIVGAIAGIAVGLLTSTLF